MFQLYHVNDFNVSFCAKPRPTAGADFRPAGSGSLEKQLHAMLATAQSAAERKQRDWQLECQKRQDTSGASGASWLWLRTVAIHVFCLWLALIWVWGLT